MYKGQMNSPNGTLYYVLYIVLHYLDIDTKVYVDQLKDPLYPVRGINIITSIFKSKTVSL